MRGTRGFLGTAHVMMRLPLRNSILEAIVALVVSRKIGHCPSSLPLTALLVVCRWSCSARHASVVES